MKRNIPFMILANIIFAITLNANNDTQNLVQEIKVAANDEMRALRLNKALDNILNQLDELTAILEYLGQAIDKGAIKVEDRKQAREWIAQKKQTLRAIKKSQTLPIIENDLFNMAAAIQGFTNHISSNIETEFENLTEFFPTKQIFDTVNVADVEDAAAINDKSIEGLRTQANEAGLTTVNIIARKIDNFNNKFGILKNIKNLCIAGIAGTIATYLAPRSWFLTLNKDTKKAPGNLNRLQRFKEYIGTSQLDPDINPDYKEIEKDKIERKNASGVIDNVIQFCQHKDIKVLSGIVVGAAIMYEKYSPKLHRVNKYFDDLWHSLKGFNIPNNTNLEFIDDIDLDSEVLIGIDSQIGELRNLVRYITSPEIYDRSNSNLEKGILLTGPSRTGKTLLARALAGTLDKAFKEQGYNTRVGFKELKPKEIVWNAEGIKTVIEQAKQMAPCVLFIDEIHNLPLQSKEGGGDILTEFLTGMSGVNSENDARHQIILLAATNQPQLLDGALLQPGRFGTIIRFEKPSAANRKKYFDIMFKRNSIDTNEIDVNLLVRQTQGCTYGDLETIIKNARFTARTLAKGVTQQHLQDRIDKHVHRLRDDLPPTQAEKDIVAANLSGQALAQMLLKTDKQLEFVTLRGRWPKIVERRAFEAILTKKDNKEAALNFNKKATWGHISSYSDSESLEHVTLAEKEKLSKIRLSGAIAEKILLGSTSYGYRANDKHKAFELAKSIALDGMQETDLTDSEQLEINKKARALLNKYVDEITELFNKNKSILESIAANLKLKITLTVSDISGIINKV